MKQVAEFTLEVADLLEVLVHAREPDVGHLVEPLKVGQHLEPDPL
jgi:hypothetical protein